MTVPDDPHAGDSAPTPPRGFTLALTVALVLLGALLAFLSGLENSPATDEPLFLLSAHAAAQDGVYDITPEHPPLAPLLAGSGLAPLHLRGSQAPAVERAANLAREVRTFLYENRVSDRKILLFARMPFLLVYLLLAWGVILWSRAWGGEWGGVVGAAAIALYPWCIGSAVIIQTDLVLAAAAMWTFYVLHRALINPRYFWLFSIALGLALSSKASALLFLPLTALLVLVHCLKEHRRDLRPLAAYAGAVFGAFLLTWAVFTIAARNETSTQTRDVARMTLGSWPDAENAVQRIGSLADYSTGAAHALLTFSAATHLTQNRHGVNYIFGRKDSAGFWYYFPVAWFIKSPLPYLALLAFCLFRRRWGPEDSYLWIPIGLYFLASAGTSFNIGIRHLSPVFPFIAVFMARRVGKYRFARPLALGWALWMAGLAVFIYPNYLSHFNLLFSRQPERYLLDSNLDWGQDWDRAAVLAKENGWSKVVAVYWGTASPERHFDSPAVLYTPGMDIDEGTVVAVSLQTKILGPDMYRLYGLRAEADALSEFLRRLEGPGFAKIRKLPGIEFYVPIQGK